MKFKIPSRFMLGGQTYNIRFEDTGKDANGWFKPKKSTIYIKKDERFSQDFTESLFFHELSHAILFSICEDKLNENEEFVDRIGKAIHQAIKTME